MRKIVLCFNKMMGVSHGEILKEVNETRRRCFGFDNSKKWMIKGVKYTYFSHYRKTNCAVLFRKNFHEEFLLQKT